jgi:hypothetical protein
MLSTTVNVPTKEIEEILIKMHILGAFTSTVCTTRYAVKLGLSVLYNAQYQAFFWAGFVFNDTANFKDSVLLN